MASSVNADSANVAALANDVKPNVGAPSPMQLYVALAKDSTNASYATRAGSATDSTKLPLAGGTMNSSAQILMTGRRVTPAAMYYSGGLQVREAAFAGTSDGYIGMAPQIGFHWGGRVASSLALGSDNKFYQVTNGGSVNALATESYVNSKVSSGGSARVISTGRSGLNWYRVWSDGFKEQGYYLSSVSCNYWPTVYLLKPMSTTTYTLLANYSNSDDNDFNELFFPGRSTTAFTIGFKHAYRNVNAYGVYIYVAGY